MNTSDTKSAPHAIDQTDGFDRLVVSSHLHRSVLDALPAQIAVLDQEARIIAVNRAWRAFSAEQHCGEHDRKDLVPRTLAASSLVGRSTRTRPHSRRLAASRMSSSAADCASASSIPVTRHSASAGC